MISYYTSKHPGLMIYLSLLLCSVMYFLLLPVNGTGIGLLALGWSGFTFMRALSLFEITRHPEPLQKLPVPSRMYLSLPSALPYDLHQRLNGKENLRHAGYSLHAVTPRSLILLGLALFFALCDIYIHLHGLAPATGMSFGQKTALLFIFGACFWSGQTYADNKFSQTILFLIFIIVILAVISDGHISIPGDLFSKLPGLSVLCAAPLFIYGFIMFIPSVFKTRESALNAIGGIGILLFMVFIAITNGKTGAEYAVFIAALSLFSLFWMRCARPIKKTYLLRV